MTATVATGGDPRMRRKEGRTLARASVRKSSERLRSLPGLARVDDLRAFASADERIECHQWHTKPRVPILRLIDFRPDQSADPSEDATLLAPTPDRQSAPDASEQ